VRFDQTPGVVSVAFRPEQPGNHTSLSRREPTTQPPPLLSRRDFVPGACIEMPSLIPMKARPRTLPARSVRWKRPSTVRLSSST
jgi:hypothetical protein